MAMKCSSPRQMAVLWSIPPCPLLIWTPVPCIWKMGYPYLEYTSLSSREEISTQETEAAAQQAAQQQAQQEAAAQQEQGQQQEEQGCLAGALISLSFEKEG